LAVHLPIAPAVGGAWVAGLPAASVVGGVDGDAVEPCGDFGAPLVAGQFGGQGGADVLGQVFGVVGGAGQTKAEAEQAVVLAGDQAGKGLFVTVLGRKGQVFVRHCHAHH